MIKQLFSGILVVLMFSLSAFLLSSCGGKNTDDKKVNTVAATSSTAKNNVSEKTSDDEAYETVYVTVTDKNGQAVTDADKNVVTSAKKIKRKTTTTTTYKNVGTPDDPAVVDPFN